MRKIDLLRELQELDSALDRAREGLEQRRPQLGDDGELVPLREELEQLRHQLRSLREKGRELDDELEKETAKRKAEEKKLYDGSIRNPKELGNLAQEVEMKRQQISHLEDQALMNMDALENATAAAKAAERALSETERTWKAGQTNLVEEIASLDRQVEELSADREKLVSQIDGVTLRSYESLRRTRGGLAVVAVEQRACRGCRISLSSSEVQRARATTDLVTCQSCGRILYVPA